MGATLFTALGAGAVIFAVLGLFAAVPGVAVVSIVLLGGVAFLVAAPLNARVFQLAGSAPTLASAANTAAFNVGNALGPVVGGLAVIDGNRLPQAPEWIANFTLRYGIPMSNGELFVYTDWSYRSEVNFFLYESTEFTGKELLEGGLRLGYAWSDGKYEAALFGRNITDEVVAVGAIDFDNLTGFLNEPQIWGVQFKASF